MAFLQSTGKTPTGLVIPIPVAGLAQSTVQVLSANQSWDSGIIPYNGNEAVHFAIAADVAGSYAIQYYLNGQLISFTGNATSYDPELVNSFQGALSGKGDSFKLVYTNGPVAQTRFYLEIRFGDDIQQTLRSIGVPISATNMGGTTHAVIEAREDGTGNYKQATVTTSGAKIAQDVNVVNSTQATDVSALAKEATLKDGSQKTQVTNFPATQSISAAALPLPTGAATAVKQDTGNTALGTPTDAVIIDPTASASIISLLKGLLQESVAAGTTGALTSVSLAANVQQTIAANVNRKMVVISSTSGTILIGVGFTATASNWSYRIVTNGTLEIPQSAAALSISLFSTAASTVNVTQIT